MMEIARQLTPSTTVCRRRLGRARHIARLLIDDDGEGRQEGIGDIDDDFDMVDVADVIRAARGGRRPVVRTDSF